ncbi:hypothetical protein OE09_0158 [Flavobacteriaceae bacterium MAR_2010_72]|nr:hypothetical protein OE09_0158 [Flavobacteriaceae bacterium MAR_2010_72]
MNSPLRILIILMLCFVFMFYSCRTEETEFIEAPEDETLTANSVVANLIQRTAMNDGSKDNILDFANCFTIKLPINVNVNGSDISINSIEDLSIVEFLFDDDDDDLDILNFQFPLAIVFSDFTETTVHTSNGLIANANTCNGENESDTDIECLDFQYPIDASVFNTTTELIERISLNNDKQLYEFIKGVDQNDVVNIRFPIKVVLSDGTSKSINNLNELQNTIQNHSDDCDEDDDYDYNDDDCDQCTKEELETLLTQCGNWYVDKLERNDQNYDNVYQGYRFNFYQDGTVGAYWGANSAYGTWIATGTGNNITVEIDFQDLPYCENNWILHEIQSYSGETKVDLRVGGIDRLRYEGNCN